MKYLYYIVFFSTIAASLSATELLPWFGRTLEIEAQAVAQLQAYRSVAMDHHSTSQSACDLFVDLSANTSYEDIAIEIEAVASKAQRYYFGMDCLKLTGRYRWMNDIVADPVSLVTGISLGQVFKPGLKNLSSFHHGNIEGEFYLIAGKEHSVMQLWTSRYWGGFGVGIADKGYPWIRGNLAWEYQWGEMDRFRFFANSVWGLGHKSLRPNCSFDGYGPIRHQSIDIGFRYSHVLEWSGTIICEYGYRIFARNCPKGVNITYLSINYPFGL